MRTDDDYVNVVTLAKPMMIIGQDGTPIDLPAGSIVCLEDDGTVYHAWPRRRPLARPSPPKVCKECQVAISAQTRTSLCPRCRAKLYMRAYRRSR